MLPAVNAEVPPSALTDRWRRTISYLRISVTDRCNYACAYCMPATGFEPGDRDELLTFEEILRLVAVMAELGVRRVRVTGGEPLVRKGVVDLVAGLAAIPGVEQVALTTNGHLLDKLAQPLWNAGLRGLNVSLDTFHPGRFGEITRGGDLVRVLSGLLAAEAAGFTDIRINAVVVQGVNDQELADFAERCWRHGWLPRFIELMPIGGLDFQAAERRVTTDAMLAHLARRFALRPEGRLRDGLPRGPADYHVVTTGPFAGHRLGIISPMTDDGFCAACNRARLTARGGLRACLADDAEVPMWAALRNGASREALVERIEEAVYGKRVAHRMREVLTVPQAVMTGIGG